MQIKEALASYCVIPLRDIVVFPGMVVSLLVGREKSIATLERVVNDEQKILLLTQKDSNKENPAVEDLYAFGVVASIRQLLKLPDGTVKVLVEGERPVKVHTLKDSPRGFRASVENRVSIHSDEQEIKASIRVLKERFAHYAKLYGEISAEVIRNIVNIRDGDALVNAIAQHSGITVENMQSLIEQCDVTKRLQKLLTYIEGEITILHLEKDVQKRVKGQMEKNQREYYLNEKMKAIGKELDGDTVSEIEEYKKRLNASRMPAQVKEKVRSELKKIKSMPSVSAESSVVRNYIDCLLDLPWKKHSKINLDIAEAEKILDRDHYGLKKIKERILELLSVNIRTKKVKGPIICLVGPPGVGKTSLGESIAKACGRKFVRISLGGVRDEAEIRGHRRTYVGSMPGRIIQGLKKAKSSNPVFLLDEIEKMGYDHRGDPSASLLEILDPSQNKAFVDHYLEVEYDLSEVMFVTTANSLKMSTPLLDRMEVINLSGYTEEEKLEIAKRHLLKRTLEENGLKEEEFSISDSALLAIIRNYTREAGVRNLEREIQKLARKSLRDILQKRKKGVRITSKNLQKYAGVKRFTFGIAEKADCVGMVTGLAWTSVGGEILQIESALVHGKGKVIKTGKLGDVMQESISAAETYIRSHCLELGVIPTIFSHRDIHIHVPEGGTPKDGPSAGIAMVTAIVSCLTNNPVKKDIAMTGEVTLRGKVLAIGGLKEKLLAALRGGIKTVLIPTDNEKDLIDIPSNVTSKLHIVPVKNVRDVLQRALKNTIIPVEWNEEFPPAKIKGDISKAENTKVFQ